MEKQQTLATLLESPKNWVSDFAFENGKYTNICLACDSTFLGHRRRRLCYQCADHSNETESKVKSDKTA